jgi:protocatechuate 3,4-dioxygenase, beta subunit
MNIFNTAPKEVNRNQPFQLSLGETSGIHTDGIGCKSANGETAQASLAENHSTSPAANPRPCCSHAKNGDGDVDITTMMGKPGQADGEAILVRGIVRDENGLPVEGALVEMRQANKYGRYSHELDKKNAVPLDPNFEGRGEMTTGADGSYGFKTIRPGKYAISGTDWRTPHIHFRISRRGFHEVATQMYFAGEALNETDMVLLEIPEEERAKFVLSPSDEKGIPVFYFNISLRKLTTFAEHLASLDAFVGSYDLLLEGEKPKVYRVSREGIQLYLEIEPCISVQLNRTAKDEFLARPFSRRCIFNRLADGSVDSLTFKGMDKANELIPHKAIRLP